MSGASATEHRNSAEIHPHNPHVARVVNPSKEQVDAAHAVDPYQHFEPDLDGWIWHLEIHRDISGDNVQWKRPGTLKPFDNSGEVTKKTDQRMGKYDAGMAAHRMQIALHAYTLGLTKPVTCRAAIIERIEPIFAVLRHRDPIAALQVAVDLTEKGDYDFRARRAVLAALDGVMIHFPKTFQREGSTSLDRHVDPHVPKPATTLGSTTISGTLVGSGTNISLTIGSGTSTSITISGTA